MTRLLTAVAAIFAATAAGGLIGPSAMAAGAGPLPTDPAARGYVGLCNEAGQNVTGGSIDTRPFVWTAVSTSRPPASYQGHGQSAVLGVVQPRAGTGADQWNGTSLTAASFYRDRTAPTAQATYADASLRSIVRTFPPQVDGLYVLRMYFGRTNYGDYSTTYPTTVIQVTGSRWRVVRGGTVDCSRAKAVSEEQLTGAVTRKGATAHRPPVTDRTLDTERARPITAAVTARGDSSSTGGGSHSTGGTQTLRSAPAAETTRTGATSRVVWALVAVVAVLVLALGLVLRSRRTRPPGS